MTTETIPAFEVYAGDLLAALNRVKHAMATNDRRPILASFLIEEYGAGVWLAAADNYRVASQSLDVDIEGEWPQTVVAREGVPVLADFLKMAKGTTVRVERLTDRLRVSTDSGQAEVRLVDGMYPDLRVVTDAPVGATVASFNPKYLADAGNAASKSAVVIHMKATGALAVVIVTDDDGYTEWIMPVRTTTADR